MKKILIHTVFGLIAALTFATAADAYWCRWIPGHRNAAGFWVPGHRVCGGWRGWGPRCRWIPGHYNYYGRWVPAHRRCRW